MSNPALYTLLGTLATGLGLYLIAARRFGGKIKTSEAAQLWEEASNLRREYKEEIARLESRLGDLENRNRTLVEEHQECKRAIREHEKTIAALREELKDARKRVEQLEVLNGRS